MHPLDLVGLTPLLGRTTGSPDLTIGLIDGPVFMEHPELDSQYIREIPGSRNGSCKQSTNSACSHGTFVAGILSAKRGSVAPGICPSCTVLARPIFAESTSAADPTPSATPSDLAQAILECLDAGARLINVSAALAQVSSKNEQILTDALDRAARLEVIVLVAAGNEGSVGSTSITSHPWVIPVVGYDLHGRPLNFTNLGSSIGRRGLGAPGDQITSLGTSGKPLTMSGTSAATPFVTGAIALLWSAFPKATVALLKAAITQAHAPRRTTVVPPLMDAWAAYQFIRGAQ